MNSPGILPKIAESVGNYRDLTQQAFMSVVLKFKDLRGDLDFDQKVCQVAFAALELIMMHYPGAGYLNRTASLFVSTAGMHDFYRGIQHPRHWFFPVSANTINEFAVRKDVTNFLSEQFGLEKLQDLDDDEDEQMELEASQAPDDDDDDSETEFSGSDEKVKLRKLVQHCIAEQLRVMGSYSDAYRNLDEFKGMLQKQLNGLSAAKFAEYEFKEITLDDLREADLTDLNNNLSKWTRHVSFASRIAHLDWVLTDLVTVVWFLQEWHLLDTAKWSARIGQYPGFQWVNNYDVGSWVLGLVCGGFSWTLFEAVRKLQDEALTKQERRQAQWDAVTSFAELFYFGALFLNHIGRTKIDNVYIHSLAIGAKSLGLISIAVRPNHEYFQRPEAA